MTMGVGRSALFVTAACVSVVAAGPALAQSKTFDIPAQAAQSAISALGQQADVQIIAARRDTRGKRTNAVHGNMTVDQALSRLLAGTGLTVRQTGPQTYSVVVAQAAVSGVSDSSAAEPEEPGPAPVREDPKDIVVTGTNIRGQQPVGSQLIVIGRKEIEQSGHTTAAEIVRALPQNFAGGVSNDTSYLNVGAGLGDTASGSNANGGTALNLRGVGAGATLTLVNGRRPAPSGTAGAYTDVSTIPISAIERVEVLPDGASALYGSDAIGGVVNFVLRRDFNGAETRATFGTVTDGPLREVTIGQTIGKRWSTGGILLTGEYYHQTPLPAIDRDAFNLDFRRYGGADRRTAVCTPGTITVGGQNFALTGTNGATTPGTNLCSPDNVWLYPRVERENIVGFADQSIGSIFRVEVDGSYAHTINTRTNAQLESAVTVPSTNPYYINPLGNGAPVTVQFDLTDAVGPSITHIVTDTYGGGVSLIAKPLPSWSITASVAYGAEKVDQHTGYVDYYLLPAIAAGTTVSTALNPFATAAGNSQAVIDLLHDSLQNDYKLKTEQWIYRIAADGPLFTLPGGEVRVAVGGERREIALDDSLEQNFIHTPAANGVTTDHYQRDINAGFGEIVIPIFGAPNAMPGLRSLELGFALRGEEYSDFGSVVVPKAGVNWSPFNGFKVRASFSRSYRAPSPTDLVGTQYSFLYRVPDSQSQTGASTILILNGGNNSLHEERARTWNFGFDWVPPTITGLRFGVSYFDIAYTGRILVPSFSINVLQDPTFTGVITRGITASQQAALCAATVFGGNASGIPGTCATVPVAAVVDARVRNVAALNTSGIDIIGSYDFALGPGRAQIQSNVAYVFRYAYSAAGGQPDYVNTVGNVPQLKIRSSIGYALGGFSSTLFMDYIGSSHDSRVSPAIPVKSYASFDLSLGYALGGDHGLLGHTRLNLNVQNLFDRQPPFVDNIQFGYDYQNYDLRGRFIRLSLTKGW